MKCAACGYEKEVVKIQTHDVTFFKSGKNKGQIKDVTPVTIEVGKDKPDFIDLELQGELSVFAVRSDYDPDDYRYNRRTFISLCACPVCGTVRLRDNI